MTKILVSTETYTVEEYEKLCEEERRRNNPDLICPYCKNSKTDPVDMTDTTPDTKEFYPPYYRKCYCCRGFWVDCKHKLAPKK